MKCWHFKQISLLALFTLFTLVTFPEFSVNNHHFTSKDFQKISFKNGKGELVDLESFKGKVVFINFWATWCFPCTHEMPTINKLRNSFKGNDSIVFMMVDVDANFQKSNSYMRRHKYDLEVYTPNSEIPSSYLGHSIPTTIILDKKGDIAGRIDGATDYTASNIVDTLKELLQE